MTLAQLAYLLIYLPLDEPIVYGLDLLNETVIQISFQLMYCLTDLTDERTHEFLGWIFIVLVCILICTHLLFLLRDITKNLKRMCLKRQKTKKSENMKIMVEFKKGKFTQIC